MICNVSGYFEIQSLGVLLIPIFVGLLPEILKVRVYIGALAFFMGCRNINEFKLLNSSESQSIRIL